MIQYWSDKHRNIPHFDQNETFIYFCIKLILTHEYFASIAASFIRFAVAAKALIWFLKQHFATDFSLFYVAYERIARQSFCKLVCNCVELSSSNHQYIKIDSIFHYNVQRNSNFSGILFSFTFSIVCILGDSRIDMSINWR